MKSILTAIAVAAALITVVGGGMRLLAQPGVAQRRVAFDQPEKDKTPKKPKPIGEPRG